MLFRCCCCWALLAQLLLFIIWLPLKVLLFGCMAFDPLLPNGDGMGGVTV